MFPKFLRPEAFPFASFEFVRAAAGLPVPPAPCAWCPDFDPTTQAPGLSHGMCQACSDRALFELMHSVDRPDEREELAGATCGAACGYCGRCS